MVDVCRPVPIIWFQLLLSKLLGNIHGVWTTKITFHTERGRKSQPYGNPGLFHWDPVFHCSSLKEGNQPGTLFWPLWWTDRQVLKGKLATVRLDFRSSRKSFSSLFFFFFLSKVYTRSEKQFIADVSAAQGSHTRPAPMLLHVGGGVDPHKPNRHKQTDVETHLNKCNFLQN